MPITEKQKQLWLAGEKVDDHWKHKVWRNIPLDDTDDLFVAIWYYYAAGHDQIDALENPDGTWDIEAVYGAEDMGDYDILGWDGIAVLAQERISRRMEVPQC